MTRPYYAKKVALERAKILIGGARTIGAVRNDDDICVEAGLEDANEFWTIALSSPMDVPSFAGLLARFFINPDPALNGGDLYKLALQKDLRLARKIGEAWFITTENGEIWLDPRKAAEWLLLRPLSRDLLPESLKAFLESKDRNPATVVAPQPEKPRASTPIEDQPAPEAVHARRSAGRPKGSGSFQKKDAPLLVEMKELVDHGASVWSAAGQVVSGAKGGGTEESKRKRLAEAYSVKYSS